MTDLGLSHLPPYDAVTILDVLRDILERGFTWRNELAAEIAEPDFGPVPAEYHGDMYADDMYIYTYRDAACSHATVGALAPFFEGVFRHEFSALRVAFGDRKAVNAHHRWRLSPDDFWSPNSVSDDGVLRKNPDIVRGVKQLFTALDIHQFFPETIHTTINALFTFRNYALHNGYEWPVQARTDFKNVADRCNWGTWFSWATWNGKLWIVSLTDGFVSNCLESAVGTIKGFHELREEWMGQTELL